MSVLLRLSQHFAEKSKKGSRVSRFVAQLCRRFNVILNTFDHPTDVQVAAGVVFHHPGVIIASGTIIEPLVHIYGNVTFGRKNGKTPHIGEAAKICGHTMIIGGVKVGKRAIVAPGAIVVHDIEARQVVAGVPAKSIGKVDEENYNF